MTDSQRVGTLWALVLAVFALFNAVYWPVHWHQADLDPANFMRYSAKLHAQGQLAAAIDTLKSGIAGHHPPLAEPYETLQTWLREFRDDTGAAELQPTILFYNTLKVDAANRQEAVRTAVHEAAAQFPSPQVSSVTAHALQIAASDLCITLGVPLLAHTLDLPEQFALFTLAGGNINTAGTVGKTATVLSFDLVVQSGGGAKGRRIAHIFLRGRDYGGNERGFHVVLIEPATGQMLEMGVFDVWSSDDEANRMASLLAGAAPGTLAAFAVLDDASLNMNEDLERQLRGFGLLPEAMIQRHAHFFGLRYSFAAIGVKGAVPGQAMQAWSPGEYGKRPGHPVACMVLQSVGKGKGGPHE